jgi:hypothetical protein
MQTALATIQNLSLKDTLQFLEEAFMQDGLMIGGFRYDCLNNNPSVALQLVDTTGCCPYDAAEANAQHAYTALAKTWGPNRQERRAPWSF